MESKGRIKITGVRPCTSFVVVLCALMIYYNSTYTVQYNTIQYNFIKGCFQFYCSFTENRLLLLLCHLHIILVCFDFKIWSLMVSGKTQPNFFQLKTVDIAPGSCILSEANKLCLLRKVGWEIKKS